MSIGVICGSGKVEMKNGSVFVDPQARALASAVDFIASHSVAKVGVDLDHLGLFRTHFLDPEQNITQRQKRHLRLAVCCRELREAYAPLEAVVSLTDVHVLTEDLARAQFLKSGAAHHAFFISDGPNKGKVSCRGVWAGTVRQFEKGLDRIIWFLEAEEDRIRMDIATQGIEFGRSEEVFRVPVTLEWV